MSTIHTVKQIPFGAPVLDQRDIDAVTRVLQGPILTHGPMVERFEHEFAALTGVRHAVAVSSCTAALHLSMLGLQVGPGDEVLVPAQTHTATAHAPEMCGARPVFCDVDPQTGNIMPEEIERRLTPRTKAIILVHFLGLPCDMDAIVALAGRRGIPVVEDCALAIGTRHRGKPAGSIGVSGCFSFYPIKHITTGEGGMVTTNDSALAARAGKQRAFGIDRGVDQRPVPGVYDVKFLGNNYRMSEMSAALGVAQLAKLAQMLEQRRRNTEALRRLLGRVQGISLFREPAPHETSGNYCLSVMLTDTKIDRDRVILALKEQGIGASIYYATPLPFMTYYRDKYGCRPGDFPNAEFIGARTISLPVGAHLAAGDVEHIADSLNRAVQAQ